MISLQDVTKEYNLGEQVVTPVRNISLDIDKGEFVMLVGRSGSGKSTLLNLVAGLVKPKSGRVAINGNFIDTLTDKELSRLRNQQIGFVFQFPSLLPSLSILENVIVPTIFSSNQNKESINQRAKELLDTLGLSERMHCYPRHLSAGEQKRAVIARSLMNKPQILLADEPTSDLDEQTEREIMCLMKEIYSSGVTILLVTHSLQLVPYANRTLKMESGKLVPVNMTG